jgi:hypothetical protein
MKKFLLYSFLVLILFLPAYSGNKEKPANRVLSDYQKNIITYFQDVALGFEFGTASKITRKWKTPMKIFVEGTPNKILDEELVLIVAELNSLITDDFTIEIVTKREASNFRVFFGSSAQYASLYPVDRHLAHSNSGVYHIFWNKSNQINTGQLFVNMNKISLQEQKHVLREELTQSLGLGRDSELYAESVFQSSYTTPTQYAAIDKDIIRLLYHPNMTVGLSAAQVEMVLTEILLSENSTLTQ